MCASINQCIGMYQVSTGNSVRRAHRVPLTRASPWHHHCCRATVTEVRQRACSVFHRATVSHGRDEGRARASTYQRLGNHSLQSFILALEHPVPQRNPRFATHHTRATSATPAKAASYRCIRRRTTRDEHQHHQHAKHEGNRLGETHSAKLSLLRLVRSLARLLGVMSGAFSCRTNESAGGRYERQRGNNTSNNNAFFALVLEYESSSQSRESAFCCCRCATANASSSLLLLLARSRRPLLGWLVALAGTHASYTPSLATPLQSTV